MESVSTPNKGQILTLKQDPKAEEEMDITAKHQTKGVEARRNV